MEIDRPINLIIEVLDEKAIDFIAILIRAHILVDLKESPEALSNVSASLINNIGILCHWLPFYFSFQAPLIIKSNIVDFLYPVSTN